MSKIWFTAATGPFGVYSILVIGMMFPSEKEHKFGISGLFILGHLLKLWSISCHKLCQLVDYIPHFRI